MGKILKDCLPMKDEIEKRKMDPNWSRNLASCVIQRYTEESENSKKVIQFPIRKVLAAAAALLLGLSIGWYSLTSQTNTEDEYYLGISSILEGESYLSSLEE
ncbi:hypothetical protein [Leptospira sarikeiensis]|uniref:Uncharacterized protein n=1 Tax=Leptospira sarikeiensis TaxID=2484943 RepID=A0A4R9K3Q8_9LEPT|nr:hypothetical protein [Leptospira sarikeiensis]TGL60710.1 hypothetical protein EHQ64_12890 [Leptospira sarikeiensis]